MLGDSQPLEAGATLGEFRILSQIGEGGMGVVYLARDDRLTRRVALKVIAPQLAHDPDFQERFGVEARSAAAIDHPNIVPIYSAGVSEERLYIAMRFVDGTDLRTVLREDGRLDPDAAVAVIGDVAAALDAAHAAGLVHRDVKPANVLLDGEPGVGTAYLTDFGLTKGLQANGAQLTGTGQWIGTVDYVAPEQMTSGRVDARTDVYALGCVLYETVAGEPPFTGSDMQKMWHQVNEPVPPLAGEGEEHALDAVISRATAKDPDERFQSAGDLARAARAAVEGTEPEITEQSVATGAAAVGLASADGLAPTRTMSSPRPGPRESPTVTMAAPKTPHAGRVRGGGPSGRLIAAIAASVVLAGGLIGAALVLAGGKSASTGRTVVNNIKTVTGETQVAPTGGSAGEEAEVSSTAAPEEASPEGSEFESGSDGFYPYERYLYGIEVPEGWVVDEVDEFNGTFYESTWYDPADPETKILVDAETPAPSVSPMSSAETVRSLTESSSGYYEHSLQPATVAGLPAARWVFDVDGHRRVDYFVNSCGVGLAMLGSTDPGSFSGMASTFNRAAASIYVPCE